MTHAEERLLKICDDLLACCGELRAVAQKAGQPWPNGEAKALINRLLDTRNVISPPKPITTNTKQP